MNLTPKQTLILYSLRHTGQFGPRYRRQAHEFTLVSFEAMQKMGLIKHFADDRWYITELGRQHIVTRPKLHHGQKKIG